MTEALRLSQLQFGWRDQAPLLRIDKLQLNRGENVLLRGPSGSGKSTLLGLIGGVLLPQRGDVQVCGQSLSQLPARRRDRFRAEHIGLIFQLFNLLPYLDVVNNVLLPLRFAPSRCARAGSGPSERVQRAHALLDRLGLAQALWQRPAGELSIGQQQRVAAARALIGAPTLILADEPTSALDTDNRDRFLELLLEQARDDGSAVLLVSHDPTLAAHFERQLEMADLRAEVSA
jgi:putative ABC transport system ATP-binding protein